MPDLNGYTMLTPLLPRSEGKPGSGATSFNNNLIRPSNRVGLHPQLVHYDVHSYDGNNVGVNKRSTVEPGRTKVYQWYAGMLQTIASAESCPNASATGGFGILNDVGGKPFARPLAEIYDANAFREMATALTLANKTTATTGGVKSSVRTMTRATAPTRALIRAPATPITVSAVDATPRLTNAETTLVESLVAAAKNANCIETPETGLSPGASEIVNAARAKGEIDEAPLIEDASAVYDRRAIYLQRKACSESTAVRAAFDQAVQVYNRTEAVKIDSAKLATQLSSSFVNDVGGVDDGDSGTAASYRWAEVSQFAELDDRFDAIGQIPRCVRNERCMPIHRRGIRWYQPHAAGSYQAGSESRCRCAGDRALARALERVLR